MTFTLSLSEKVYGYLITISYHSPYTEYYSLLQCVDQIPVKIVDAAIPGRYLMVCLIVVLVGGLGEDRTASTVSLFKSIILV